MFISEAFAQSAGAVPAQGSMTGTLIQLGLIFVIFYVLLIRPQGIFGAYAVSEKA